MTNEIKTLRILRPVHKGIYFVIWLAASLGSGFVDRNFLSPAEVAFSGGLLTLAFLIFAVRNFRGTNEDSAIPRYWWRMTSRPRSGFIIAALAGVCLPYYIADLTSTHSPGLLHMVAAVQTTVLASLVLIFFLHSSIRLLRMQAHARPSGSQ